MSDIDKWLTAVKDEEERQARATTAGPWRYSKEKATRLPGTAYYEEGVFAGPAGREAITVAATGVIDDPQSMTDGAFIAAHDPTSVLARIAADRQILALHSTRDGYCNTCGGRYPCLTVRLLAMPYADRPGYREEWRP